MEHFIDREQEMETLQTEYDRNGSSLVILYGRRRVGKTTLISEFIKDKKPCIFLPVRNLNPKTVLPFRRRLRSSLTTISCEMQP